MQCRLISWHNLIFWWNIFSTWYSSWLLLLHFGFRTKLFASFLMFLKTQVAMSKCILSEDTTHRMSVHPRVIMFGRWRTCLDSLLSIFHIEPRMIIFAAFSYRFLRMRYNNSESIPLEGLNLFLSILRNAQVYMKYTHKLHFVPLWSFFAWSLREVLFHCFHRANLRRQHYLKVYVAYISLELVTVSTSWVEVKYIYLGGQYGTISKSCRNMLLYGTANRPWIDKGLLSTPIWP